jgi:signal transduction histidine kinase/ActR/RegA family two-component response regulator
MPVTLPRTVQVALDGWVRRLPRSLSVALGLAPIDPLDAALLRGAQVRAIVRVSPIVVAASCLNAAIMLATFAALHALRPAHWIWALALVVMAARFLRAWRGRKSGALFPASHNAIRRVILNGAVFGALWGIIPVLSFPGAALPTQLFIACLTSGMMCAGAFVLAAVPLAGIAYVLMVAAGSLFALLQEHGPVYVGLTALLTSYTVVIVIGVNWSAALLMNSLLAEAQVRREVAAREKAQAHAAHAERMTALGQLAGGIAHDFNNILQVVSGGASRIDRNPESRDAVVRQAQRIQEAVERGAAISSRLLAFARRDALSAEPIDAAGLLSELGELMAQMLGPSIRIHVDTVATTGRFLADRRQLETVILNLAGNARDAMPGGGELTISAASLVLEHDSAAPALRAGRYVRIAVTDTGVGMSEATLARVAEPFFTTKPKGMGTGLGLSMAKGFAEQSDGALEITSEPGAGATILLWFPQADPDAIPRYDQPAREGQGLEPVGAGRRVLVVDDDEPVREVLVSALEDAGFVILGAANAKIALDLLEQGAAIDAVVTDFSMPGMNGIDLIHEIHSRRPDLPAILLTGHVGDVIAAYAFREQEAEHFTLLQKPVRPGQIAERLAAMMPMAVV